VTVKIRAGWMKDRNYLEIGRIAEACGWMPHPSRRTRGQGYGGKADWQVIAEAKRHLRVPVIGNGRPELPEAVGRFFNPDRSRRRHGGRAAREIPGFSARSCSSSAGIPGGPSLKKGKDHPAPSADDRRGPGGEIRGPRIPQASPLVHPRASGGSSSAARALSGDFSEIEAQVREFSEKFLSPGFRLTMLLVDCPLISLLLNPGTSPG